MCVEMKIFDKCLSVCSTSNELEIQSDSGSSHDGDADADGDSKTRRDTQNTSQTSSSASAHRRDTSESRFTPIDADSVIDSRHQRSDATPASTVTANANIAPSITSSNTNIGSPSVIQSISGALTSSVVSSPTSKKVVISIDQQHFKGNRLVSCQFISLHA